MYFRQSDGKCSDGPAPEANQGVPVCLSILNRRASWRLKSWLPDHGGSARVEVAGLILHSAVGTAVAAQPRALCLAPDEWLVVADRAGAKEALALAAGQMDSRGIAAVNLSDALSILHIEGREVRAVLSKACGLDLHPRMFPAGRCARTRFAGLAVTLDCVEQECFDLYVARSYSSYLRDWLLDAAAELRE